MIHFSTLPSSFSSFWEMTTWTKLDITRKPVSQIRFCKTILIVENVNYQPRYTDYTSSHNFTHSTVVIRSTGSWNPRLLDPRTSEKSLETFPTKRIQAKASLLSNQVMMSISKGFVSTQCARISAIQCKRLRNGIFVKSNAKCFTEFKVSSLRVQPSLGLLLKSYFCDFNY